MQLSNIQVLCNKFKQIFNLVEWDANYVRLCLKSSLQENKILTTPRSGPSLGMHSLGRHGPTREKSSVRPRLVQPTCTGMRLSNHDSHYPSFGAIHRLDQHGLQGQRRFIITIHEEITCLLHDRTIQHVAEHASTIMDHFRFNWSLIHMILSAFVDDLIARSSKRLED